MMKHYKDQSGVIHGFEDGRPTPEGMAELTPAEVEALLNPEPTVQQALDALKNQYLEARHSPIDVGGSVFQVNGDSEGYTKLKESSATHENFAIAVSIAAAKGRETNGSTTIPWTLMDNTDLDMTREEIQAVITAIGVRGAELHYDYQDDKAAILAQ